MVGPSGYRFWEMLDQVVQEEPPDTVDPTTLGCWASIGIQKGKVANLDAAACFFFPSQTRSMLQTDDRFPSVSSQNKDLLVNADGSVDVYFGPKAPPGKESNWVQTIPGQSWFTILRLYGPLAPWFDKSWKPGEIELQR